MTPQEARQAIKDHGKAAENLRIHRDYCVACDPPHPMIPKKCERGLELEAAFLAHPMPDLLKEWEADRTKYSQNHPEGSETPYTHDENIPPIPPEVRRQLELDEDRYGVGYTYLHPEKGWIRLEPFRVAVMSVPVRSKP